jgi:C1A family cysteine protease
MKKALLTRKLTLLPSPPDERDYDFNELKTAFSAVVLPKKVDLSTDKVGVYDQLAVGSCTANSIAGAIKYLSVIHKIPLLGINPSRLFIYYNERELEGTVNVDTGAYLKDGIKTVNKTGYCKEETWKYITGNWATKPTENCYKEAENNKISAYYAIGKRNLVTDLKTALSNGFTVVFGFQVLENINSITKTKCILKKPKLFQSKKVIGGHAVLMVGYDTDKKLFKVQNSWGEDWGQNGYFYMTEDYLKTFGFDFWVITM